MEVFFNSLKVADETLSLIELDSTKKKEVSSNDSFFEFKKSFDGCFNNSHLLFCTDAIRLKETVLLGNFPTLFLEFADLDLSNKIELRNFILKYGFLTNNPGLQVIKNFKSISLLIEKSEWTKEEVDNKYVYTEPLTQWILFQIHLRRLIRYWRALHCYQNKKISLDTFIDVDTDNPLLINDEVNNYFAFYFKEKNHFINFEKIKDDFPEKTFKQINVSNYVNTRYPGITSISKTKSYDYKISDNEIINFINDYLKSELNNLLETCSHSFSTKVSLINKKPSLLKSFKDTRAGTNLTYNSLMGGILFQLSNSISLNKKFKRCLECQNWMEFSTQGRLGKKYCNSNCRAGAFRRRESIKLLYELARLQGKFSLKKYFDNFCKAFNKGRDEYLAWQKNIDDDFKDKQKVKSLLDNIIFNILNNLNVYTSTESIAEHLDLDHNYIKSINLHEGIKVALRKHKISGPYFDWDYS